MRKPRVTVNCVANHYAGRGERIIEFFSDRAQAGGLISIREADDGRLIVDVYRHDDAVEVRVERKRW